ncbi:MULTISPECIES: NAD(P)-dependent oxidoreductase [unclassified Leptospira]|uniref:NAD(P)-dependent oxidoreductase n=1 Tax=unclassified Leptospira TaxID=2633828 RepID=UPI0002925815|nr:MULTISPECIES: NAD(P)-dependent oxidoreductase [unclassified Leptospira]EKO78316.1 cytidylyltransferase [Leptospira sp. Fiocruz LV3954]EMI69126.1 cytidylyltransferase [Leptospira sp. Fiocruz LV4135]
MHNNKRIIAVIQARGGSKGIPKKNIYPLVEHPLISYSIAAALNSKYIDELVVTTDSEEIAEIARKYGAKTPFLRPAELSGDNVLSVDSLRHAVIESEKFFGIFYDYVIELPCVSPLRDHTHIDSALEKLFSTGADSVISVVNTGEKHPVRLKRIINDQIKDFCKEFPEPKAGSRRQDLEDCYIRNGAIYSMTRSCLIDKFSRHGEDSRPYIMPDEKSINIDSKFDLKLAEILIREGYSENKPKIIELTSPEIHPKKGLPKILVTCPLHFLSEVKKQIIEDWNCIIASSSDKEKIREILRDDVEAWICNPSPTYMIDESLLRELPMLKILATPSTGSNHIDKDYCKRNGISVLSLKDTDFVKNIYASSEYTFALMLSLVRNIPFSAEAARKGLWRNVEDKFRGHEFEILSLGIIGYGRIGSNLARYSHLMVQKIYAYDPYVKINDSYVQQESDYKEVLAKSDILAICVHLDENTIGMVNESWFKLMKHGVYFVNTSRGEIINEKALLENLSSGKIKSAALDVISNEQNPNKINHPIVQYARNHDNLILTPHIAGLTYESEAKAARFILNMVKEALRGEVEDYGTIVKR